MKRAIKKLFIKINPRWYISLEYKRRFGVYPRLDSPQNFNEKILWLILNWQHPLIVQCADKYRMRHYVEKFDLGHILPDLYGVWGHSNEIDWDKLPNQFVIKCNHGCNMNIICTNKNDLDLEEAKAKLDEWMNTDYGGHVYEPHYSEIVPVIMAEEYIINPGVKMPIDYKIYCFNGKPEFIMACIERETSPKFEWYDFDWNVLDIGAYDNERKADKPRSLDKMIEYASQLCNPFPFVRVDFYEREGCPILGELTFTPYFGMAYYYSDEGNRQLGDKLVLPKETYKNFKNN